MNCSIKNSTGTKQIKIAQIIISEILDSDSSKKEQRNVGLDNCTEDEFLLFNRMNDEYKLKFSIPFIFAVKGVNKSIIIDEFKRRLTNEDIDLEIAESIKQVKKIAKFRLDEIINE